MVLTDRQNTFYERIHILLGLSSSVTVDERDILTVAYMGLESGDNFKRVINALNLRYKELEIWQPGGLTQDSKKLRDDLISVYGEPKGKLSNWEESDPEYIFSQRAWIKRGEETPNKRLKFSDVFSFMSSFLILVLIILSILFFFHKLGILD